MEMNSRNKKGGKDCGKWIWENFNRWKACGVFPNPLQVHNSNDWVSITPLDIPCRPLSLFWSLNHQPFETSPLQRLCAVCQREHFNEDKLSANDLEVAATFHSQLRMIQCHALNMKLFGQFIIIRRSLHLLDWCLHTSQDNFLGHQVN